MVLVWVFDGNGERLGFGDEEEMEGTDEWVGEADTLKEGEEAGM